MKRNIRLTIAYDGTDYSGWQCQKNAVSIQQVIEDTLGRTLGHKVSLKGSGRTDSGVHAKAQIANFRTSNPIPLNKLQLALNTRLPKDIVITHADEADPSFDAQHSAKSKIYRYTIANNDYVDPFARRYATKCFYKLDLAAMKREAKSFVGKHNFTSFQATDKVERDPVRTINSVKLERDGDLIHIEVEADGFLYNMVRNIAGTLIEVGRGKFPEGSVKKILASRDRRVSGPTAPPEGLCLIKVKYE